MPVCTYRVNVNTVLDDIGSSRLVYGIEAVDANGNLLLAFRDVFFDKDKAEALANRCNSGDLSLSHFEDVINDALTDQYACFL